MLLAPRMFTLPYSFGQPTRCVVPQNSPDWFAAREKCHYTASEIPSVVGCGYDSPAALFRKKTGRMTASESKPNFFIQEAMKRGQVMEMTARSVADTIIGRQATEGNFWTRSLRFEDTGEELLLGASPDGIYEKDPGNPKSNDLVLEIKCPLNKTSCDPEEDTRFWTYYVQIQVQLFCTGIKTALLFIYHPGLPNNMWMIDFSRKFWGHVVIPQLRWHRACCVNASEPKRQGAAMVQSLKTMWAFDLVRAGLLRPYCAPIPLALSPQKRLYEETVSDQELWELIDEGQIPAGKKSADRRPDTQTFGTVLCEAEKPLPLADSATEPQK